MQPSRTAADQSITRYLFPRLIAFVTNCESEDPERARSLVCHSLTQYVSTVDKDRVPAAMSLVVPALLARTTAEQDSHSLYRETSSRLLELAAIDQLAFRAVVGGMNANQRTLLEEIIRSGQQATNTAGRDAVASPDEGQPTIALKMNFGN